MSVVKAIRGAIQLNDDSQEEVREKTVNLVQTIVEKNTLSEEDIISIQFTQTSDIVSMNPARALRSSGFHDTPLFCMQEPAVEGALPLTIRVMITCNFTGQVPVKNIYLNGAETLRPDWAENKNDGNGISV